MIKLRILLLWDLFIPTLAQLCWKNRGSRGGSLAYIWTLLCGLKKHKPVISKELKRNLEFGALQSMKFVLFKQFLVVPIFVSASWALILPGIAHDVGNIPLMPALVSRIL